MTAALCLIALVGLTAFSLVWSPDVGAGFVDVVRNAGYAGTFILAGLTVGGDRARGVLGAMGIAILLVAGVALAARLGGVGGGDTGLVESLGATSGRLSYPLGYWNALGALMAIGMPLLVWIASEGPGGRPRGWALAGLVPLLLVAFMTSSRGALLAALVGVVVVVAFAASGRKAVAVAGVATAAALPALLVAGLADGILTGPGTGEPGGPELAVGAALVLGMALGGFLGPRLVERLARGSVPRVRIRRVLAGCLVAVVIAAMALVGPGELKNDFLGPPGGSAPAARAQAGLLTASSSGRAQFWGTALEAFADQPVRGFGAGSYPTYWNAHGTLVTPTRNAHSEPLELMAELGVGGLLAFCAFFVVVVAAGVRRAREPDGPAIGAALGVTFAALVGFLIDWTWQVPAVVVPVLIAAAIIGASQRAVGSPAVASGRTRSWGLAVALVGAALPALWAGGVLVLSSDRLDESAEALEQGEYAEAAQAARAAASLQPWASEPWERLATIEQAAGNLEAARRDVHAAIDRAPTDFRLWLLAVRIELNLGEPQIGIAYRKRALQLAPLVLPSIASQTEFTPGSGL